MPASISLRVPAGDVTAAAAPVSEPSSDLFNSNVSLAHLEAIAGSGPVTVVGVAMELDLERARVNAGLKRAATEGHVENSPGL